MTSQLRDNAIVPPVPQEMGRTAEAAEKNSYGQILKSSVVIGGSSVVNIGIRIVRTKAMAMLLGPMGVGLMGAYESIANLAQSVAGMGVSGSGVRQIAEAMGTGETERIARAVSVLRKISIILGVAGAVLLILFRRQVSSLTFGNEQYASAVALLSLVVLFNLIAAGQGALIQGMRRISDLARISMLGMLLGTIISVSVIYFLGERGIVPSLVGIAAMTIVTSWWYSRKVQIKPAVMTTSQVGQEAAGLLKLGFAFMASGFLMMGAAYAVRTMVLRMIGFDAAGYYQAAWAIGGLYVGFILQAMGADFYPRLTAIAKDNAACNRMVNEQAQVSLLLAGPGVIATLTFTPIAIALFYSGKFDGAVGILRWICLGMTMRVITWPMGFIIVAKGKQTPFFLTELAWTVVNVGLSWLCLRSFGLNGAGMAFFGSYVFHGLIVYPTVRHFSGFRWSVANRRTGLLFSSLIAVVFCGFYLFPFWLATAVGVAAALLSSVYSVRALINLIPLDRIPRPILKLLVKFRFAYLNP